MILNVRIVKNVEILPVNFATREPKYEVHAVVETTQREVLLVQLLLRQIIGPLIEAVLVRRRDDVNSIEELANEHNA